jgi:hypothetical protein
MKISFLNLPTPIIISPKKAGLKQSLPFFMSDEQYSGGRELVRPVPIITYTNSKIYSQKISPQVIDFL